MIRTIARGATSIAAIALLAGAAPAAMAAESAPVPPQTQAISTHVTYGAVVAPEMVKALVAGRLRDMSSPDDEYWFD